MRNYMSCSLVLLIGLSFAAFRQTLVNTTFTLSSLSNNKVVDNYPNGHTEDVSTVNTEVSVSSEDPLSAKATIQENLAEEGISIPVEPTVITWERGTMRQFFDHFWMSGAGNEFCETINSTRNNVWNDVSIPITFNISLGCEQMFQDRGSGNYVFLFYGIRLAARVLGNVGIDVTCDDAEETKKELILPWLTGWFPPRVERDARVSMVPVEQACGNYDNCPIVHLYKEMQYDLRRMAIGLVGVPGPDHPSARFAEEYLWPLAEIDGKVDATSSSSVMQLPVPKRDADPIFPLGSVDLDDAVIHFRCGDLMDSIHEMYGFMKFSGYTRHISPDARSVSILTQPFDSTSQNREIDAIPHVQDRCRIVVTSFVGYIQKRFPSARVRIHNDSNETIALSYARMVMANQTIVGISTFGIFPTVATFGRGYMLRPLYKIANLQLMLDPSIDQFADNVVAFDEPDQLMASGMKKLWETRGEEGVLEWFWSDEVQLPAPSGFMKKVTGATKDAKQLWEYFFSK